MTTVGLISDPHATAEPVAEALSIFKRERVDEIWCTGDIVGYGNELEATIALLKSHHCQAIRGNHEIWYLQEANQQSAATTYAYLNDLPSTIHRSIDELSLMMVHASPPNSVLEGIRLLDQNGQIIEAERQLWSERLAEFHYHVLIVGHTHQAFAEQLGQTLVINPGSSHFNHSCAILCLPDLSVQWYALGGHAIQKSWNWSKQAGLSPRTE